MFQLFEFQNFTSETPESTKVFVVLCTVQFSRNCLRRLTLIHQPALTSANAAFIGRLDYYTTPFSLCQGVFQKNFKISRKKLNFSQKSPQNAKKPQIVREKNPETGNFSANCQSLESLSSDMIFTNPSSSLKSR